MAFAMNYWQITASHVQRTAPGQPAAKPNGAGAKAPVQSQSLQAKESVTNERLSEEGNEPRLSFEDIYTRSPQSLPQSGNAGEPAPRLSDKVVRMLQASPNLTMEQVKAILKIDRFD